MNYYARKKNFDFLKRMQIAVSNDNLVPILLGSFFWFSAIFLEFVLWEPRLGSIYFPYGQYPFFFFNLLFISIFVLRQTKVSLKLPFTFLVLAIPLFFFLIGFIFSYSSLWGLRLVLILGVISSAACFSGKLFLEPKHSSNFFLQAIFLAPFFFPPVFATILELTGPLEFFLKLENSKDVTYQPQRWFFLFRSANGFGIYAGIAFVSSYIAFFSIRKRYRVVFLLLMAICLLAVINSGTRAAMVFCCASVLCFHLLSNSFRDVIIFLFSVMMGILLLSNIFDFSDLYEYLRLTGSINEISSQRWVAIKRLWTVFLDSPFVGVGFGEADKSLNIKPTNSFYFAVLVEVGIFGAIGLFSLIFLPLVVFLFSSLVSLPFDFDRSPYLLKFSLCILVGLIPYQLFEFNIFRVSVINQLFFFSWGYLIFFQIEKYQQKEKNLIMI